MGDLKPPWPTSAIGATRLGKAPAPRAPRPHVSGAPETALTVFHLLAPLCALAALHLVMPGCGGYAPKSTEWDAEAYYRGKYRKAAYVADSHALGCYRKLGFDAIVMEYIMSGGMSVACIDGQAFRDDRQSE